MIRLQVGLVPWFRTDLFWGAVIVILHLVGAAVTALGHAHLILPLTPIHLVVCAGIVMAFTGEDSPWKWAFTMFLG